MKILVTGCSGLLGANICYLARSDHDVVGLARTPFFMDGVRAVRDDFANSSRMDALFDEENFDAVIHCAALTNVDECEKSPEYAFEVNAHAAIRLAKIAENHGSKFVFISTDAVFPGTSELPYREIDATNPLSVYGKTKVRAEEGILPLPGSLIVRTNMYGFNYREKSSLSEWVIGSLESRQNIKMFNDVIFNPLFANTLSEALLRAASTNETGILNLGNTTPLSKYEFGLAIADAIGEPCSIEPISVDDFGFTAPRAHFMHLDCERAQNLGFELPSLLEDIDKMVACKRDGYAGQLKGVSNERN